MEELISEQQADWIVAGIALAVLLGSLGFGFFRSPKVPAKERRLLWANCAVAALAGPVIWVFWLVYNAIENHYGLDSLKALGINFLIAVSLGAAFFLLFTFVPNWVGRTSKRK